MVESERLLGTYTRYGKLLMLPAVVESAQRWIELLEFDAHLAQRRAGAMSLGSWLGSLRGVEARALGAWDDPMPRVVGLFRLLRKLGSGIWSAARRLRDR